MFKLQSLQRVFAWGSSLVLVLTAVLTPMSSAFAVTGQPDLSVNSVRNVHGILSINAGNHGTRNLFPSELANSHLYIYVNGELRRDYFLSQLDSTIVQMGNTANLTPFTFGSTYLPEDQVNVVKVCIDPTGQVSDPNVSNNCLTKTFLNGAEYTPRPDLKLYFVRNIGGLLSIQVGNGGMLDINPDEAANSRLEITIDGVVRSVYLLGQLNSDLLLMNRPPVLTPLSFGTAYLSNNQDHVVRVCVDTNNQITESDENNNCMTETVRNNVVVVPTPTVEPAPVYYSDLTIHGLANSNGLLWIKVGNQGQRNVSTTEANNGNLTITIDGTLRRTYGLSQLNAEFRAMGNATVLTPFAFGTTYLSNNQDHVVQVCVDASNQITESNESNNCRTATLRNNVEVTPIPTPTVEPVPVYYSDLTVHGINNRNGLLSIKVGNQGERDVSSSEATRGKLTISVDGMLRRTYGLTQLNAEFLAHGNATTLTPFAFGTIYLSNNQDHVIRVCIDATNQITESNESNNCMAVTLRNNVEVPLTTIVTPPTTLITVPFATPSGSTIATPPAGFEDKIVIATSTSPNPFADTSMSTPEGQAAATLYNNAIIGGYPDGTFGGNRAVNRAEAAKFLLLARDGNVEDFINNGRFKDVLDGQWYVRFVVRAAQLGIIQGYADGNFRPGDQVNTAEFLKMMTLAFGLPTTSYNFTDVDANAWYAPYVGIATKYNLFPNRGNTLRPGDLLTRNEVAVAIYQYLVNR